MKHNHSICTDASAASTITSADSLTQLAIYLDDKIAAAEEAIRACVRRGELAVYATRAQVSARHTHLLDLNSNLEIFGQLVAGRRQPPPPRTAPAPAPSTRVQRRTQQRPEQRPEQRPGPAEASGSQRGKREKAAKLLKFMECNSSNILDWLTVHRRAVEAAAAATTPAEGRPHQDTVTHVHAHLLLKRE